MAGTLFMTTQPGWAFATLAELRSDGFERHAEFWHRDSTVIAPDPGGTARLWTPAEVFGCLARTTASGALDATTVLRRTLKPAALKDAVLAWLPATPRSRLRRYSLSAEVWGQTTLRRDQVLDLVRTLLERAFPSWKETSSGGLRLVCKADASMAALGVQLYSNLTQSAERAGSLRPHLADSLLTLAGVREGDVVFDPFMGSGTILRQAGLHFGCASFVGLEIDPRAYELAKNTVGFAGAKLLNLPFQQFDPASLPPGVKLVSNLPFGVRFQSVSDNDLIDFLSRGRAQFGAAVLLSGRRQASVIARRLGFRTKNVLVLGQPAAIAYLSLSSSAW